MGRPRKSAERASNASVYDMPSGNVTKIDLGELSEKQAEFWKSKALYTCIGGARGGGKTHVMRAKAIDGAIRYPGIKILIVRRKYSDLIENHILPIKRMVPQSIAEYNNSTHIMYFCNGSTIKFSHFNYDSSADDYQGQEYDWIFMDEATQFTEHQFRILGGCLRGVNNIPKRYYLSCNPGGIGHNWVKRLFIDKKYNERENPKDYKFIFATVTDNKFLMESSPGYISMLDNLPEKIRAAHRDGNWDILSGTYFNEFTTQRHVIEPFPIPREWRKYRAFDYGLDMFACYWIAVDFKGHCYVYREYLMGKDMEGGRGLIVSEAAAEIHNHTLPDERIEITFAPPDIWNTQKTDGKTMAEDFLLNDVPIIKVSNNRVQGHMQLKQMMADMDDGKPQLLIFSSCRRIIEDISTIQADEKDPNDCAREPHDITHTVDALRYFAISRTMPAIREHENISVKESDDYEAAEDYESYMCGGEVTASYIGAHGGMYE